jgi:hypothetical protein
MYTKACVENFKRQKITGDLDKRGRLMIKWLLVEYLKSDSAGSGNGA